MSFENCSVYCKGRDENKMKKREDVSEIFAAYLVLGTISGHFCMLTPSMVVHYLKCNRFKTAGSFQKCSEQNARCLNRLNDY